MTKFVPLVEYSFLLPRTGYYTNRCDEESKIIMDKTQLQGNKTGPTGIIYLPDNYRNTGSEIQYCYIHGG